MPSSFMGCALPSINNTSWPGGVSACRRNIQRCGMKLRVTPLSGLYSRIFIYSHDELIISGHSVQCENLARGAMHHCTQRPELKIVLTAREAKGRPPLPHASF